MSLPPSVSRRVAVRGAVLAAPVGALLLPSSVTAGPDGGPRALARTRRCGSDRVVIRALTKDMTGNHAGLMHGVPLSYNWALGPRVGVGNRPGIFTAVSAWGQVYESAEGSPARNVRVACRDIALHILSRSTHQWSCVNDSEAVNGANYVEDFTGNTSKPADLRPEPNGSVSATLGGGYNFHLYSTKVRALIDPNDVAGVVCSYSAKVILDDPSGVDERDDARYLASAGADYWLDGAVGAAPDTVADAGIGKARWVRSHWKTFTMSTVSERRLHRNPPPVCLRGR